MHALLLWYGSLSLLAFTMFGWDKSCARDGRYRTAERKLFAVSFLGGWPGSFLGREIFRHKTKKVGFGTKLGFVALLNVIITTALCSKIAIYF